MFKHYSIISAWIIWGLRAEWMLNTGTEATKGWLFCGDAARSRVSQDRKNVFFWEIVHIVLLNICRTVVWLQQQLCAGRPLGFVSNWRNLLELDRRFLCCKTLTISQDRQNTYILRILFRLWSWKIAGWPVLQLQAMWGNWVFGLASSGEVLSDHGELAKCWRFKALSRVDIFGCLVRVYKSLYAFHEKK